MNQPRAIPRHPALAAAQRGDRQATGELLTELLPFVRKTLARYVGCRADLDDWTQDVLVKVVKALPTFRGEAALTTWVHRIAVRHVYRTGRTDGDVVHLDFDIGVDGGAAADLDLSRILEAIEALPPHLRMVFVMRHIEGYTAREISEMLEQPKGTTATRIRSARLALQRTLRAWSRP